MRPSPLRPHRWNDAGGQVVPAEHIRFELGAEHVTVDVLERAWLGIPAIVEKRGELPAGRRQHCVRRSRDRGRLGIIEIDALDAKLVLEPGDVFRLPRRGEHTPAPRLHGLRGRQPDA